jgi:hypothetical protein
MKTPQSLFIVPSLLLALVAAPQGVSAGDFVIAQNGNAKTVVVVEGGVQSNGVTYAANVLADFLGRLSGTHFMVASKPVSGYNTIRVGAPYRPSKPEELRLRVVDDRTLEVTGDGPRGTMHAVSELLERLGVVFCAHDYDYVPSRATLSLTNGFNVVDAPFMTWRDSWTELQRHHPLFMMKLRLTPGEKSDEEKIFDTARKPNIDQNMCTHYVNRDKFLKDHADWYAYVAKTGQRNPHWVCVSSEGMYQELFREIEAELAKDPQIREISVGVDDGYSMCECANCLKQLDAVRDPDGAEVGNLQYVILANRVGRHFEKSHPNVRFNLLAYDAKMPSNPKVMFNEILGAWAKLTGGNVYIWGYNAQFKDYLIVWPTVDTLGPELRTYRDFKVKGVYMQMADDVGSDMLALRCWLCAKLMWNPDQDEMKLIEEWCNGACGKGGKYVFEWMKTCKRVREGIKWLGVYTGDSRDVFKPEDILKGDALLAKAEAATKDDPVKLAEIRRVRGSISHMMLVRYYYDVLATAKKANYPIPPREALVKALKDMRFGSWTEGIGWDQGFLPRIRHGEVQPEKPGDGPRTRGLWTMRNPMTTGTQEDPFVVYDDAAKCYYRVRRRRSVRRTARRRGSPSAAGPRRRRRTRRRTRSCASSASTTDFRTTRCSSTRARNSASCSSSPPATST